MRILIGNRKRKVRSFLVTTLRLRVNKIKDSPILTLYPVLISIVTRRS